MKTFSPKDVDEIYSPYNYESGIEPSEWNQVAFFNSLDIGVICVDNLFGAINSNGKIIIPIEYDNLIDNTELNSTHILAKKGNLWGYINWKNEILIPFEYSYASIFQNDEALVCKEGNYFIINTKNQILRKSEGLKKLN